jgi:hypothetical protein
MSERRSDFEAIVAFPNAKRHPWLEYPAFAMADLVQPKLFSTWKKTFDEKVDVDDTITHSLLASLIVQGNHLQ